MILPMETGNLPHAGGAQGISFDRHLAEATGSAFQSTGDELNRAVLFQPRLLVRCRRQIRRIGSLANLHSITHPVFSRIVAVTGENGVQTARARLKPRHHRDGNP